MSYYVSTYSGDYVWPDLGAYAIHGGKDCKLCKCSDASDFEEAVPIKPQDSQGKTVQFKPLLDPVKTPAKFGCVPTAPTSLYNQPDAFLEKLQIKFPMLYTIVQNTPSPELQKKIKLAREKYDRCPCGGPPDCKCELRHT